MTEAPEVEVEVEVEAPPADPAPDVVVVDTGGSGAPGVDGDTVALLATLSASVGAILERLASVEARVDAQAGAAEAATLTAEAALSEAGRVAEETEEAVATLAVEAEAATAEVQAEVDDIAPDREHMWFKRRSVLAARGDE